MPSPTSILGVDASRRRQRHPVIWRYTVATGDVDRRL